MEQIQQDFIRFKQPAMAVAGGIAAALVIATLPHVYLENIVGMTGLSEIVPAAAPPLGNTARGLIAIAAGMVSASALYLFLNHKTNSHEGGSDMSLALRKNLTTEPVAEERDGKSRFSMPKLNLSAKSLTKFLKKPKKAPGQVTELKDLPDVRAADRHPDAPVRQPIFAASDLGTPLAESIKRFDPAEPEQKRAEPVMQAESPVAMAEPAAKKVTAPEAGEKQASDRIEDAAPLKTSSAERENLSTLSLAQLADRLEAGLRRLEVLERRESIAPPAVPAQSAPSPSEKATSVEAANEPAPVAIPPLRSVEAVETADIDTESRRQADMDAALKAALGTLEKMTAHR
ncbi:hypothetical protein [Sphingorhabdus sp. 109]|uniref:hypothetical protein n=1 Tax=Sphingorhabdus sp. 109 TaxID=2653173 RepID=UPI0012EF45C9|nr:hypothetical protein [Sphingorhabdus sp. 109]VWX61195.1 conserved hypothetical protein [Sphingorhabdus sp. 109]